MQFQSKLISELDRFYTFFLERRGLLGRVIHKKKVKSIYIYGPPGGGKTFLVNLFFKFLDNQQLNKKISRLHFQDFINMVHNEINEARLKKYRDPLKKVSNKIAKESRLICFDELEIIDIADAMIVSKLFNLLIKKNILFVITSNYKPDELYKNGLQRSQFIPFIDLINRDMNIVNLRNTKDLRSNKKNQERKYFIFPINKKTEERFQCLYDKIIASEKIEKKTLISFGRKLEFEKATSKTIACDFSYICSYKFSSNDYIKISNFFRWILIDNIPILGRTRLSEARKFIILIDILYEKRNKIIIRSENNLFGIFKIEKKILPFTRTISRLSEMTNDRWHTENKRS